MNDMATKIITKIVTNLSDYKITKTLSFAFMAPNTFSICPAGESNWFSKYTLYLMKQETDLGEVIYKMGNYSGGFMCENHPSLPEFYDIIKEEYDKEEERLRKEDAKTFEDYWNK